MIKFHEQVPLVYSSASRDFQYLGWLINIVLNSVKHNVDCIYDLPNSKSDPRLTELLAMTLGFKVKRNYDHNQLRALVAALPRILKYKGTQTAIDMAGNALIAASGAIGDFTSEIADGELTVTLPKDLVDISLFTDLLPYILPAGMSCHIERTNQIDKDATTKLALQEAVLAKWVPDLAWDDATQAPTGLANMFNTGFSNDSFANFLEYAECKIISCSIEDFYNPADPNSINYEKSWHESASYQCFSLEDILKLCPKNGAESNDYNVIATVVSIENDKPPEDAKLLIKIDTKQFLVQGFSYAKTFDKTPTVGNRVLLSASFIITGSTRPTETTLDPNSAVLNSGLLDNGIIPILAPGSTLIDMPSQQWFQSGLSSEDTNLSKGDDI